MKSTAAIVVTYNRPDLLKECITSLLEQDSQLDIYIIDNHSTDNTRQIVEEFSSKNIFYYDTGKNIGGAGGFNFGLKTIANKGYRYGWLMDDDTIPEKNALSAMLTTAKELNDDFSFLSSVALWTDGNLCKMNIQSVSENAISNYKSLYHNVVQVDYASFVSCFINLSCVDSVGLPLTDFYIYGDDMEYTLRLSKIAPGYLNPYSVVTHKMKSNMSINLVDADAERIDRYFYNFRNLCYIYKRLNKKEYRIYKLKSHYLALKILFKSKSHKLKRIIVLKRGMRAGKRFNPTIEKL